MCCYWSRHVGSQHAYFCGCNVLSYAHTGAHVCYNSFGDVTDLDLLHSKGVFNPLCMWFTLHASQWYQQHAAAHSSQLYRLVITVQTHRTAPDNAEIKQLLLLVIVIQGQ